MSFQFRRSVLPAGLCVLLLIAAAMAAAGQTAPTSRQFPPGALQRIEDLPAGRFRADLDRLPPAARQRALEWLQQFHFTELDLESLQVDSDGGVYYADVFSMEPPSADTEPVVSAAAVPVSPFPEGLIFHSRPGAANVLYLNW